MLNAFVNYWAWIVLIKNNSKFWYLIHFAIYIINGDFRAFFWKTIELFKKYVQKRKLRLLPHKELEGVLV